MVNASGEPRAGNIIRFMVTDVSENYNSDTCGDWPNVVIFPVSKRYDEETQRRLEHMNIVST